MVVSLSYNVFGVKPLCLLVICESILRNFGERLYFGSMGLIIHFIPISQWMKPQEVQCPLSQTQTQGAEVPPRLLVQRGTWAQGSFEGL